MLIMKIWVFFNNPLWTPFPISFNWKENRIFWKLKFSIFITPIWSFMWKQDVFKDSQPNSLILESFKFSDISIFINKWYIYDAFLILFINWIMSILLKIIKFCIRLLIFFSCVLVRKVILFKHFSIRYNTLFIISLIQKIIIELILNLYITLMPSFNIWIVYIFWARTSSCWKNLIFMKGRISLRLLFHVLNLLIL